MDSPFDLQTTWLQNPYNLDRRLIKAISKLGFVYPTLVQAQTIPLALEGKDILVRARTGSGKTLAFALPLLQKILQNKSQGGAAGGVQGIILAPTKELIKQIAKCVSDLLYYCRDDLTLCTITEDNTNALDYKMRALPDIILSTPAKLVAALKGGALDLSSVQTFVLDEADLVLSYGYKEDIHKITSKMPKIFQGLLVSATLSAELDKFKRLLLHQPVVLKLEETQNTNNLMQFYVDTSEEDKYLALYVFLKLGILQGKGLIFVNDVNKCYKLKLFLQQFFISAAVLNAEIPLNSRTHILEVRAPPYLRLLLISLTVVCFLLVNQFRMNNRSSIAESSTILLPRMPAWILAKRTMRVTLRRSMSQMMENNSAAMMTTTKKRMMMRRRSKKRNSRDLPRRAKVLTLLLLPLQRLINRLTTRTNMAFLVELTSRQ